MTGENGYYRDGRDVRRTVYFIRECGTVVIALVLVLSAAYAYLFQHRNGGPIFNWAGVVVGVYIGGHYAANGAGVPRSRRSTDPPTP